MNDMHERIAEWAGVKCRCEIVEETYLNADFDSEDVFLTRPKRIYAGCPRHSNCGNPPDYSRDEVAIGLLPELTANGYNVCLSDYYRHSWVVDITEVSSGMKYRTHEQPTIAAAIVAAVSELIGKETQP